MSDTVSLWLTLTGFALCLAALGILYPAEKGQRSKKIEDWPPKAREKGTLGLLICHLGAVFLLSDFWVDILGGGRWTFLIVAKGLALVVVTGMTLVAGRNWLKARAEAAAADGEDVAGEESEL